MLQFFELFNRGGWVMYVILGVSIYAVGIIIYKTLQFANIKLSQTEFADQFLDQFANQPQGSEQVIAMYTARLRALRHPLAKVLEAALAFSIRPEATPENLREEVGRIGAREMAWLESHLRGLDLASNLAPFLGLLGMVLSMVAVFSTIESAGARVDVTLLAGGIWEALLTTVFGLIVAVIAQVGYYNLDSRVERTRLQMNDASVRLIQLIKFPSAAEPKQLLKVVM